MLIKSLFNALLLLNCLTSFGQNKNALPDLTEQEITRIGIETRNTTFGYYDLADSFSNVGDSVNASACFLKIDPYCFLFDGQAPNSIDTYITRHFKVLKNARKLYLDSFNRTYYSAKSIAYKKFKAMDEEDQNVRHELEKCQDSSCFAMANKRMLHTDNVHFKYLYDYVRKNGWPSLADGSMYASVLAIHDHDHHKDYFPVLKKAVMAGNADIGTLELVGDWVHGYSGLDYLQKHIDNGTFLKYEVDEMLENKMPRLLAEIERKVKELCPVDVVMVCEGRDFNKEKPWINKMQSLSMNIRNRQQCALANLSVDLSYDDCNIHPYRLRAMKQGDWTVSWRPAEHSDLKLFLYLTYEQKDSAKLFSRLLTVKKFTTHAINFSVNSSKITPGSISFIESLAGWMSANPSVSLEIDGHTDSDGDAVANMKLSTDRANEIKRQLIILGIQEKRLAVKGFGASKPVQSNTTPEGKAANRRVEFIKL